MTKFCCVESITTSSPCD